ncbi:hypothetical protein QUB05_05555 [Microcoleus sp. F10-C6]|uniref:hypothetical protein n=1 Tax=unclassified Microcoleus TaxID=2642155 RepID=UPI002FD00755
MTIREASLLLNEEATQFQLLNCLENLCKEYGYIEGMMLAQFRDFASGQKSLSEIQSLIEQIKQKIECIN